jgi:Protein of unknwon function (DUF3310).
VSANETQVGGTHYKTGGEEHWDRVHRLGLDYFQAQITKYVERCWKKNGMEDLKKARHFLDKYIEIHESKAKEQSEQALLGAVARGWCHEDNAKKEVDVNLATAIVQEVSKIDTYQFKPAMLLQEHEYSHPLYMSDLHYLAEGGWGNGVILYTCLHCRNKVYTQSLEGAHRSHDDVCPGTAQEPAPAGAAPTPAPGA